MHGLGDGEDLSVGKLGFSVSKTGSAAGRRPKLGHSGQHSSCWALAHSLSLRSGKENHASSEQCKGERIRAVDIGA